MFFTKCYSFFSGFISQDDFHKSLEANAERFNEDSNLKSLFVVVMSHGGLGGVIKSSDERDVKVVDIIAKFSHIQDKPKVCQ